MSTSSNICVPEGGLGLWFPEEGENLGFWRARLKRFLCEMQEWRCWVEGCENPAAHMHEAIRRSAVQGWKRERRVLIMTPMNCVVLCSTKHHGMAEEPSMEEIADRMYEEHGEDYVR